MKNCRDWQDRSTIRYKCHHHNKITSSNNTINRNSANNNDNDNNNNNLTKFQQLINLKWTYLFWGSPWYKHHKLTSAGNDRNNINHGPKLLSTHVPQADPKKIGQKLSKSSKSMEKSGCAPEPPWTPPWRRPWQTSNKMAGLPH